MRKVNAGGIPITVVYEYKISDIDSGGTTEYYGYVDADENWYILELTATSARYVKGSGSYTTNWSNREVLSYNYYYTTF